MIGREDKITEAVLFWNSRKVESLPASLSSRLKKVHRIELMTIRNNNLLVYRPVNYWIKLLQKYKVCSLTLALN